MKLKYYLFQYWESILITAGILYLSFAPPSTFAGVPSFPNEDKLVHLFLYFGLTFTLIYDLRKYTKTFKINSASFIIICVCFPILLGGAVEILQPLYFAPRTAEWFDWFSDIAGTLLGLLSTQLLKKLKIWH
jgi:VanZ family protein